MCRCAAVSYNVSASDPDYTSDQLTITCSPDSRRHLPYRHHPGQLVTVRIQTTIRIATASTYVSDTPHIVVPNTIRQNATGLNGSRLTYVVGASDDYYSVGQLTTNCSVNNRDIGYSRAFAFPIGTTRVNCTVINPKHFSASNSFNVVVQAADANHQSSRPHHGQCLQQVWRVSEL